MTVGAGVEVLGQFGAARTVTGGDKGGGSRDVEVGEPQRGHRPVAVQFEEGVVEGKLAAEGFRAVRGDEQDRRLRERSGDVVEQIERIPVGPVQIVDQEQHRLVGCRRAQVGGDLLPELVRRLGGITGAERWRQPFLARCGVGECSEQL
ncbi:MAG: hypothetical protein K0Q71_1137, partial [Thermomicrobiales bacterium]|nr:hypothetical protein [Thermomicrobiales bacterium]